jgi:tetratricopeptide (TPR) repeat protein
MSSAIPGAANEIFCSYAPKDRQYIEAFQSHLSQLQREGTISCWYDGLITLGQHRQREIETHLNSANIILLFVSADFFADDLCMNIVLPAALQRSNNKDVLVVPVLVRQCDWRTAPFAHLQALPRDGKPIAAWRRRDEAYTEIVKSIRGFVHSQQVPPMRCSLLNLPFHRNRLFTGRAEILQKLHASLESRRETALMQAIKGLGGIGKTQTAIEYAYRYQDHYARIIWLNAGSRETLISDVARLAREINIPGCSDENQNIVVRGFLTWLEIQRNWLLILDNVEDIALVRSYMPRGNQGHLLLTTRRQAVGGAIEGISLDAMDEETGATFLLKRAKRIAVDLPPEQIPAKEMQPAIHLSNVLGGLPLALDQAGGYIERKQCSLERYLQIYEQAHERLLAESGFPEDTTDYKHTVATIWSLSFQQVAQGKHGQAATDLLRLCAFLAPDDIPVSMFETDASDVSDVSDAIELFGSDLGQVSTDPVQLEETLEALLRYSLIRREGDTFFIHRLVQTVLRDAMSEKEHSLWVERAIQLMNVVFPNPQRVEYWPVCQYLLQHMLACAEWIERTHIITERSAFLLNQTACYLQCRGDYREAEPLHERALEISERQLGDEHPDTAKSLNNLALLYTSQGKYAEAEPLYKRALRIYEGQLGGEHPDTATSLNNLALLYTSQGKYTEAEPLYKRALRIYEGQLGGEHPDTARGLNNLAELYMSQGKYAEAEPLCERALRIYERQLGGEHPDTARGLNNLASLYKNQGKYAEAEPLYVRVLEISERQLGDEHPDTARSLNNLASLYKNQGKYTEAEPLYVRALRIYEGQLGGEHPDTATSLNNLAELYRSQGKYVEAEPLYERALEIRERQVGGEHPDTARSLNNLALLYTSRGKYAEAGPLYERALTIYEKQLGGEHPSTARSLNNLALLYTSQGKYAEAGPLYKRALAILINVLGENHPNTQTVLFNYAMFLSDRDKQQRKR